MISQFSFFFGVNNVKAGVSHSESFTTDIDSAPMDRQINASDEDAANTVPTRLKKASDSKIPNLSAHIALIHSF